MEERDTRDEFLTQVMRMIAPGTPLREGLENILRAKTGGLIVLSDAEEVLSICDGGFQIQCDYSPYYLYELAKMDGAIVLSEDGRRIILANTQLIPDSSIHSIETGTRHRTAERTAKQTNKIVISISQRRGIITVYKGRYRYTLQEMNVILTKANQALATLEKYKAVLDQALVNLSALEFEQLVTLQEVVSVLQRIEMVLRVKAEILRYIRELGEEGRLIQMQLDELVSGVEVEAEMLIRDYLPDDDERTPKDVLSQLKTLSPDELLERSAIVRLLGFPLSASNLEEMIVPRGYRLLYRIPRLPFTIIHNLVHHFRRFPEILLADLDALDEVEGIGEARARAIKEGLKRIQSQVFIERNF
ncbi:MAG: DNA integrity scanning protein DisA [Candidatus Carbobacillus altaicus]|uniref:diadenylate cyclase n=1 Tax=Candidatus Carbonibacillus altaicus TaxID=2163959 RepID=A0A2R6XZT9_9BACL|nr:DNA integrity scanning protein DisA [Candidatus Carbobacillus altaicus]PTQ55936.1 MAG: DNA integrity scanning protein DisA [Candidatus Carbobacillus altaicus]